MRLVLFVLTVAAAVNGDGEVCRVCKCSMVNILMKETLGDFDLTGEDAKAWSPVTMVPDAWGSFLNVACSNGRIGSNWPPISTNGIALELGGTSLEKFPDIPDAVKMKVFGLTLPGNFITEISTELDRYKQLRTLDLSGNRIREVSDHSFSGAGYILKLDLSGNEIDRIGEWALRPSLLHLNLAGNKIFHIAPESLEGLKNLAYLDLSNNLLMKLPDNFGSTLTKLKYLHLARNKFEMMPRLTRSLFFINLSSNNLRSIVLPQIDDLFVLDVSGNDLDDLDNVYEQLSLKVLKADHNNLSRVGKWKSSELIVLDFSYNNFSLIPEEINSADLPNLRELFFDGNPLREIKFNQGNAPFLNLDALGLSRLGDIPRIDQDTFKGIIVESYVNCSEETGVFVNLSSNKLREIDQDTFRNYPICSVDLSRNRLDSISNKLFNWQNSRMVDLQDNPWNCDCDFQWIVDEYLPHFYKQKPEILFELRCASPARFKNRMLMFWYNSTEKIFCRGPSYVRYEYSENKFFEMWTISMIICIVLSVLIFIVIIAIVVLLFLKPRRKNGGSGCKTRNRRSKPLFGDLRINPNKKYSEIAQDAFV
ncbi:UNVERIFIED_CONTAM: hypothetical protein PYX00_002234 [Menopon gallinae]|uniref:Uncharacterized protein n=1 Tax=Menopon gallinae TaxID=328185 RepID=A0AAW2IG31_9NEOP